MVPRFRVKKLSPKYPLPVYKESQLPELADSSIIQRAVPQIETGVEKEEEEEHDLQAAISAAQAAVTTGANVKNYIPTPDASRLIPTEDYNNLYKKQYKESSSLLRFSLTVEDSMGCSYFLDEKDENFLHEYNTRYPGEILSENMFEKFMWECESITNQQWPHLYLDASHIPDYKTFCEYIPDHSCLKSFRNLSDIFEHWRTRRQERGGKQIQPQLNSEEASKNEMNPYVCFRRRETKPVRKTRRSDQQSLERLRKLRTEMEMARGLLEMVLKREKYRKESLSLEHAVFNKRHVIMDYQRRLGIKEDEDLLALARKKRKSTTTESSTSATIKIPLHKLKKRVDKSPAQQAIEAELVRKKEMDEPYVDVTEYPYHPLPLPLPDHFFRPLRTLSSSMSDNEDEERPRYRKRVGRCGRVFIDRMGFKPFGHGGKTKPSQKSPAPTYDRYRFDTDCNKENEYSATCSFEVDEMDNVYLKERIQLLSEVELRKLLTIPSVSAPSIFSSKQVRLSTATFAAKDNRSAAIKLHQPVTNSSSSIPLHAYTSRLSTDQDGSASVTNHTFSNYPSPPAPSASTTSNSINAMETMGDKHQQRMGCLSVKTTQQQHAVMKMPTNDIIAANKAYAMQMAAAVVRQQQQQQQQQQLNAVNNKLKHNIPPVPLHH